MTFIHSVCILDLHCELDNFVIVLILITATKITYNMSTKNKMANNNNINDSRYVVIRNGSRVSDLEYSSKDEAKTEYDHWHTIITRWPDGSKLEIVEVKGK